MCEQLSRQAILPVLVIENAGQAEPLAEALVNGGLNSIEVTCRTPAAQESLIRIKQAFPDMWVGAGTVVTAEQARMCLDAGVDFGLAPGLNPDTVRTFQKAGKPFIPGVMTPSEIEQGLALGCQLLKYFPAGAAGGVALLKNLAAPYAPLGVKFCPTGGINYDNMLDYLALPVVSVVGGSWLATPAQIATGEWKMITQQVKDALERAATK